MTILRAASDPPLRSRHTPTLAPSTSTTLRRRVDTVSDGLATLVGDLLRHMQDRRSSTLAKLTADGRALEFSYTQAPASAHERAEDARFAARSRPLLDEIAAALNPANEPSTALRLWPALTVFGAAKTPLYEAVEWLIDGVHIKTTLSRPDRPTWTPLRRSVRVLGTGVGLKALGYDATRPMGAESAPVTARASLTTLLLARSTMLAAPAGSPVWSVRFGDPTESRSLRTWLVAAPTPVLAARRAIEAVVLGHFAGDGKTGKLRIGVQSVTPHLGGSNPEPRGAGDPDDATAAIEMREMPNWAHAVRAPHAASAWLMERARLAGRHPMTVPAAWPVPAVTRSRR